MKNANSRWFYLLGITLLAVSLACRAAAPAGENLQSNAEASEGGPVVNVTAKEFSYTLDTQQTSAGRIEFIVQNNGFMPHDFAIQGNGAEYKTPMIEPGESARLSVELEAGTYTYICTIPGHEQLGMRGTLNVTSNE